MCLVYKLFKYTGVKDTGLYFIEFDLSFWLTWLQKRNLQPTELVYHSLVTSLVCNTTW